MYDNSGDKINEGDDDFCTVDVLNPCWNNRPTDVVGLHWGGGKTCESCNIRATLKGNRNG